MNNYDRQVSRFEFCVRVLTKVKKVIPLGEGLLLSHLKRRQLGLPHNDELLLNQGISAVLCGQLID